MGGQNLVWGLMQDGNDGWDDFLIAPGFYKDPYLLINIIIIFFLNLI